MSQTSARLDEVHFRMVRSRSQEKARMERGLPILYCIYRLGPILGALGCVAQIIQWFVLQSNIEKLFALSLVPLAAGVLVGLLAYVGHAWLSVMVRRFDQESEMTMGLLLEILAEIEGFKPVVETTRGIKIKLKRNRLLAMSINLRVLFWCQAWVVFSLLLYWGGTTTPSGWKPPGASTPPMESGKVMYRPDLHPGIWLTNREEVLLGNGEFQSMDHSQIVSDIQSIKRNNDNDWLFYADQYVKYGLVEDLLEQLRLAGVTKVHFMSYY